MAVLVWDKVGERLYETGVSKGVVYPVDATGAYSIGHAWNGLISFTESPSGAEPQALYANNDKYLTMMSKEELGGTLTAYTYPDAFAECDGSAELADGVMVGQQNRRPFGLCYRTEIGNDIDGTDHGYKIHIIYGALAAPSEKGYSTINDSPDAITFSWTLNTTPVPVPGFKPTASVVIDSTVVSATDMEAIEDVLYGDTSNEASLPLPAELLALITP